MSNRTLLEINHDLTPPRDDESLLAWARQMTTYFRSGDPKQLPAGVTWFGMRHHSEPCPMGEPPRGWGNRGDGE